MQSIEIKIQTDFCPRPGPRYIIEGDYSGELFRQTILFPEFKRALAEKKKLIVNLDGPAGYGTSFLEESFGGLIRVEKMDYQTIIDNLEIISNEEDFLKDDIFFYLEDANEAQEQSK